MVTPACYSFPSPCTYLALFPALGLISFPADTYAARRFIYKHIQSTWLGWQDSNLRMTGSKPAALPLGYTPLLFTIHSPTLIAQVTEID